MYLKQKGYTPRIIQNLYRVWLPPVPKREFILNHDLRKRDQKWRRMPLPSYYEERRAEEAYIQAQEQELVEEGAIPRIKHFDPVLEQYRRQEWYRRLYGLWIFIDGVPTYLTDEHYMWLQWSKCDHPINDGYPLFFDPQLDRYYFRQMCREDPWCHGYLFVGPRGGGKSQEEISCMLNNMTKPGHNRNAAIQSKDAAEAEQILFQQKMVPMFNAYPDFFKPEYSHGTDPKNQMIFKRKSTTKKGMKNVKYGPDFELSNTIRPYAPYNSALDSQTLSDILVDEIGKLKPDTNQDAYKRHQTNLKSIFRFQQKLGLIRCTTTIEDMDKGGDECYSIWAESDPRKRDDNGYTVSKIYKYFISALDTQTDLADEFGRIDREAALKRIKAERAPVKHDNYKLSLIMRKTPLTEDEAFIKDPGASPYDLVILNQRASELRLMPEGQRPGKRVRAEWVRGIEDGEVELIPDNDGPFTIFYEPDVMWGKRKILNACNFYENYSGKKVFMPCNDDLWRASCDPIKFIKTDDSRASKMAGHGHMFYIPQIDGVNRPLDMQISNGQLWEYHKRHTNPEDDFENIIKMMRYFGHSIMPEANAGEFVKHCNSRGYQKFIIYRKMFSPEVLLSKGSKNSMSGENAVHSYTEVIEAYVRRTAAYIKRYGHRLNSLPLIEQLIRFDPKKPTKFDLAVSFSFNVLALEAQIENEDRDDTQKEKDPEEYFKKFDISGQQSRALPQKSDDDDEDGPADFDDDSYVNQLMYG